MEIVARSRRLGALALVLLLAGCAAQTAAPSSPSAPIATALPTATPRPTNEANDVVYVRLNAGPTATIIAIDARTGDVLRTVNDGAVSADGTSVYWTEFASGGTRTTIHLADLATGTELRSFTVDGALRPAGNPEMFSPLAGDGRLTPDGRHLALMNSPFQINGAWVTRLAVVATETGTLETSVELRGQPTYNFLSFAPDGRTLFLEQYGDGATRTRAFDVASGTLGDVVGEGGTTSGFRTAAIASPDGRTLYRLDAGTPTTNCTSTDGPSCVPNAMPPYLVALDLASRRSTIVRLPDTQRSGDFDKYMLWSLALTPDGATLYAANPAIGVVDEVDTSRLSLRRTAAITVAHQDDGLLAAIGRFLFPVADAKRYVVGGAMLSPDGKTLFAAAHDGVAVIDTASLTSRAVWQKAHQFDTLRLSPDGLRLYAMDNNAGRLEIIDAVSGASLGEVKVQYVPAILRIEGSR
jgi:WD40 repeat protein